MIIIIITINHNHPNPQQIKGNIPTPHAGQSADRIHSPRDLLGNFFTFAIKMAQGTYILWYN